MTRPSAWLFALAAGACALPATGAAAEHPFDGRWSVFLVCADTTDRKGPVKGYEYRFDVVITEGSVQGTHGAAGYPASVTYTGHVEDDGTLEIVAAGNTGRPEYSVGKVAQGSQYGYTMQGKLERSSGQATRRELRPCTATFSRS